MNKDNNKKIIFSLIGAVILVVLITIGVNMQLKHKKTGQNTGAVSDKHDLSDHSSTTTNETDKQKTPVLTPFVKSEYTTTAPPKIDKLKQSDDLDINLVDASLRDYMHSLYFKYRNSKDINEFMENIRGELFRDFPNETATKLMNLYQKYIDCEVAIQEKMLHFETPKNEEDMLLIANEIFEFRKRQLGDELAERLFGSEYNMTRFKILSGKIYKDDALYGSEKESQLSQLSAEIFGDEGEMRVSDKTGESLYQERLLLYKKDFDEMTEDEKKAKIREFREEYLPVEDINKIEAAESQVEAIARRDKNYNDSKNIILNDPNLDNKQKQEKIYLLQDQIYGNMADEIRSGEAFSEEHNKKLQKLLIDGETGETSET
ncbi:MAG: hypothetical protein HQK67_07415, partial [Desulfamplus sp.]|nr:hypothetical protein [Desulfamplus sp.]